MDPSKYEIIFKIKASYLSISHLKHFIPILGPYTWVGKIQTFASWKTYGVIIES